MKSVHMFCYHFLYTCMCLVLMDYNRLTFFVRDSNVRCNLLGEKMKIVHMFC